MNSAVHKCTVLPLECTCQVLSFEYSCTLLFQLTVLDVEVFEGFHLNGPTFRFHLTDQESKVFWV